MKGQSYNSHCRSIIYLLERAFDVMMINNFLCLVDVFSRTYVAPRLNIIVRSADAEHRTDGDTAGQQSAVSFSSQQHNQSIRKR